MNSASPRTTTAKPANRKAPRGPPRREERKSRKHQQPACQKEEKTRDFHGFSVNSPSRQTGVCPKYHNGNRAHGESLRTSWDFLIHKFYVGHKNFEFPFRKIRCEDRKTGPRMSWLVARNLKI